MTKIKLERIKMQIEEAIMGRFLSVGNGEADIFWKNPRFKRLLEELEKE